MNQAKQESPKKNSINNMYIHQKFKENYEKQLKNSEAEDKPQILQYLSMQ